MLIAIDFDETWTADPTMWAALVEHMRSRGHEVILCTLRSESEENQKDFDSAGVPDWMQRICTNTKPKRDFCLALGFDVDVWIDDSPFYILNSPGVTFRHVEPEPTDLLDECGSLNDPLDSVSRIRRGRNEW